MKTVCIVGGGIIGLSCAVRLAEVGFSTRILARELTPNTTSDRAAAVWFPFRSDPREKVKRWARFSYHYYGLLSCFPESGVRFVEMLFFKNSEPDFFWLEPEYPFRRLGEDELPPGRSHGFSVVLPFIHSGHFLEFLQGRFRALGGKIIEGEEVRSLEDLRKTSDVVVNCSGLGAETLARDPGVYPIRGQVVVVRPQNPVRYLLDYSDESRPVYVVPRGEDCILGGTAEKDERGETPDPETETRILQSCEELEPSLRNYEIVDRYVGLRPGRAEVRLEPEQGYTGIIHNYGHGGSGFTLCWGCAEEVLKLARQL